MRGRVHGVKMMLRLLGRLGYLHGTWRVGDGQLRASFQQTHNNRASIHFTPLGYTFLSSTRKAAARERQRT